MKSAVIACSMIIFAILCFGGGISFSTHQKAEFFGGLGMDILILAIVGIIGWFYIEISERVKFNWPEWKMRWAQAKRRRTNLRATRSPRLPKGGGLRVLSEHIDHTPPGVTFKDDENRFWIHSK